MKPPIFELYPGEILRLYYEGGIYHYQLTDTNNRTTSHAISGIEIESLRTNDVGAFIRSRLDRVI